MDEPRLLMPGGPAALVIPAMRPETIAQVARLEDAMLMRPQSDFPMDHLIHARMYFRTAFLPAGSVITGALIKIATVLIVAGEATVYLDDGPMDVYGYNVIPASAGRKQAFVAVSDVWLTMAFTSNAVAVEEAEREFTDDHERLASRRDGANNIVRITGE